MSALILCFAAVAQGHARTSGAISVASGKQRPYISRNARSPDQPRPAPCHAPCGLYPARLAGARDRARLRARSRGDARHRPLRLDGAGQTLLSVKVDGVAVNDWTLEGETLVLPLSGSAHVIET